MTITITAMITQVRSPPPANFCVSGDADSRCA